MTTQYLKYDNSAFENHLGNSNISRSRNYVKYKHKKWG